VVAALWHGEILYDLHTFSIALSHGRVALHVVKAKEVLAPAVIVSELTGTVLGAAKASGDRWQDYVFH
jgi:hypothetical protein